MVLSNLFLAIGPGQIAVIAILVLLLFGGKKIPELMKGLGTGIKEFKKGVKEDETKKKHKRRRIVFYSTLRDCIIASISTIYSLFLSEGEKTNPSRTIILLFLMSSI